MAARRRAKILLVDDRAENLVALEAILQGLDHELVKVESGEEALKQLLVEDFAVILLDVQMPGMDGFETAAHIKQRERTRNVPIIFLTAIDREPSHAFRGYAAGAVDYLAKPFDPWVLRAKVAVFVDLFEKNQLLAQQTALLQRQLELSTAVDDLDPALGRAEELISEALLELDGGPRESVTRLLHEAAEQLALVRKETEASG